MQISHEKYLENLKKAITEMPKETERIVISNMDDVLDLVRENQMLEKGVNANNEPLGIYRGFRSQAPAGSDPRGYPKIRGNRFNLLDTGLFFKTMILTKIGKKYQFSIKANVPYLANILQKTSNTEKTLLGITEENRTNLDEQIIKPNLDKWLSKYL